MKKRILPLIILITLSWTGMAQVGADFAPSFTEGCTPSFVTFTNTSSGAISYQWDLGDGTTSTDIDIIDHEFTSSGVYEVCLIASNGTTEDTTCTSITIFPSNETFLSVSMCAGDCYFFNEECRFETGMYTSVLSGISINGCDSIIYLDLTVIDVEMTELDFAICEGDTVIVNGNTYSVPGIYTDTIFNGSYLGCDSIIYLDLTVIVVEMIELDLAICEGETVVVNGNTYSVPGIYIDTILNGSYQGCDSIINFELIVHPDLPVEISGEPLLCNGGATTLSVPIGFEMYSWNTGDTTNTITINSAGFYSVTVTNASGCEGVGELTIEEAAPILINAIVEDIDCNNPGTIEILVAGGTPPYIYDWSNGNMTAVIAPFTGGNYSVTITDANACTAVSNVFVNEITEAEELPAEITNTCGSTADGSITLILSPSCDTLNPGYDFIWSNLTTTSSITGLTAGSYVVTVTDCSGCSNVQSFEITADEIPFILPADIVICQGDATTLDAGPGFVNYTWSTGEATSTITVNQPGTYSVTVIDANGCFGVDEIIVIIAQPIVVMEDIQHLDCITAEGSIDLTVSGGSAGYTFEWLGPFGFISNTQDAVSLTSPGEYSLLITDANGCTFSTIYTLEQTITSTELEAIVGGACDNGPLGNIELILDPDCSNYNFTWSNGATGSSIDNLEAGNYSLSFTDCTGCSTVQQFEVLFGDVALEINGPEAICAGDTTQLFVTQDNSFSYLWQNNGDLSCDTCYNPMVLPAQSNTYMVTVTDNVSNCTFFVEHSLLVDPDCMWPGDTDTNKVVNHFDLLAIGLSYDSVGPPRGDNNLGWFGHPTMDWSDTTPGTDINLKHVDTDGNGTINADDTTGIISNWGFFHELVGQEGDYNLLGGGETGSVVVSAPFYVAVDTFTEGESVSLPIVLGDIGTPATDIYGLAFSIEYDSTIVDASTARVDFSDSWLDNVNNLLHLQRDFYSPGRIDIAVTRTDHIANTGFGNLGELFITIEDEIFLRSAGDSRNFTDGIEVRFEITNVRAVTITGEVIELEPMESYSTVIEQTNYTINTDLASQIKLFPNPVGDFLTISTTGVKLKQLTIYNPMGQVVDQKELSLQRTVDYPTAQLSNGIYLIKIATDAGVWVDRVEVLR